MSLRRYRHSSSFPACFRPSSATTAENHHRTPSPPSSQTSGKTSLATSLHHTSLGLFSLTWSRTFLGHSLQLHLLPQTSSSPLDFQFHLNFNSFSFWKKHGSKKLSSSSSVPNIKLFWDFSRAKFGSGPEPESGFFIAVVVDREMTLLVGDATKEAYARTKAQKPRKSQAQGLVLRREHVFGDKVYTTKARFGGKMREISIDCRVNEDAKLCFSVDGKRVLQIKRLKWKFRGNERIEVDGVSIQVSWDVYNWMFDKDSSNNGHAIFVFKFENEGSDEALEEDEKDGVVLWQQSPCSKGMNGVEWRKTRRSLLRTTRSSSSSSISMSSASSVGGSSVIDWTSVEESELSAPVGFSLLVYAWRK